MVKLGPEKFQTFSQSYKLKVSYNLRKDNVRSFLQKPVNFVRGWHFFLLFLLFWGKDVHHLFLIFRYRKDLLSTDVMIYEKCQFCSVNEVL